MCLPFLNLPTQKGFAVDTEPTIEALGVLVRFVGHAARPGKAHPAMLTRTPRKAEWKGGKEGVVVAQHGVRVREDSHDHR